MQITIDPEVLKEFEWMTQLYREHGAPNPFEKVEDLISYILASVADGSRRPGSWERQMLEPMGLIANCPEHYDYREHYGERSQAF